MHDINLAFVKSMKSFESKRNQLNDLSSKFHELLKEKQKMSEYLK